MIVNEIGKYKLLKDIITRNTYSIGTIPKDSIINITQIDSTYCQVIGNELFDWIYWDLPVVKCI